MSAPQTHTGPRYWMDPRDGKWDRLEWTDGIWEDSKLLASDRLVALRLAKYADSKGVAYPGTRTLASETGHARNTVKDAIGRLQDRGWIERRKVQSDNGWGRYEYRLTRVKSNPTPGSVVDPPPRVNSDPGSVVDPGQMVTDPGSNGDRGAGQMAATNTPIRTHPENSPIRTSRVRDEVTDSVLVRVESETGRHLTDEQAEKLLGLAGENTDLAVESFVDVAKRYTNAGAYKLIEYAGDRMNRDAEQQKQKRRGLGLNEPEFTEQDREIIRAAAEEVEF